MKKLQPGKKVLIAPLDWGLGHATRCIPVIRYLLHMQAEVLIAASGPTADLLKAEFPGLDFISFPGYQVAYPAKPGLFFFKMLVQIPSILGMIRKENRLLKKIVAERQIDMVISDNRYGCHHPECHSVFITHQLRIQTGLSLLDSLIQKLNYRFINQFSVCWIPDLEGNVNLAGDLSHPKTMPDIPVRYTGPLSRLSASPDVNASGVLFLISGPEPQRTQFEDIIISQLGSLKKKCTIVRGLPGAVSKPDNCPDDVTVYNHLPSHELSSLIMSSACIVARSGYSTVMDLVALRRKALLVPTPGQTEQEYLAAHLSGKGYFHTVEQHQLQLEQDIRKTEEMDNLIPYLKGETEKMVAEALSAC